MYAVTLNTSNYFCLRFVLTSPVEANYASSLISPEPYTISENVTSLSWSGFFANQEIKVILKQLLQLKQGWVNLTLHGFDECAPSGTKYSINLT